MKILLLTTHLEMGGIPIYVTSLTRGLKDRGHEPRVASGGGWLVKRLTENQIPHLRIPCRTSSEMDPKLWILALPKLLGWIRRERPDLIHAHTRVTQVLAWALHGCTGIPYVTTYHGFYRLGIGRRVFRCWGKNLMAISEHSRDELLRQYPSAPPHRVVLVRNGIEMDRFLQPPPPSEIAAFRQANGLRGEPIIGSIARLSPVKGLEFLLKAVPTLLKSFPRLQVLLVGDGPSKADLVRLAYALKIADHVLITHSAEDTRIPLSVMDCFVVPSLREGFGLALVEAMAAGKPVVATNNGGPSEIIENGKSGLLVPPAHPEELAQALLTLLKDSNWRREFAREGRERARTEFSMERVVREVEAVYTHALS
ncbi:MAG: glycosyltransferase family 4 protein [Candidatus Omnitrophica bacterium]|nr:glycosyltransferase family 4 protein [Candidatus Omnitrophota bacterium]